MTVDAMTVEKGVFSRPEDTTNLPCRASVKWPAKGWTVAKSHDTSRKASDVFTQQPSPNGAVLHVPTQQPSPNGAVLQNHKDEISEIRSRKAKLQETRQTPPNKAVPQDSREETPRPRSIKAKIRDTPFSDDDGDMTSNAIGRRRGTDKQSIEEPFEASAIILPNDAVMSATDRRSKHHMYSDEPSRNVDESAIGRRRTASERSASEQYVAVTSRDGTCDDGTERVVSHRMFTVPPHVAVTERGGTVAVTERGGTMGDNTVSVVLKEEHHSFGSEREHVPMKETAIRDLKANTEDLTLT
jgi:hypothetical protein